MRVIIRSHSLFEQGQSLGNAKAVLFIDNNKTQASEANLLLEQGMGADDHCRRGILYLFQYLFTGFPGHTSRQSDDREARTGKQSADNCIVLFGKQFRGRHVGCLIPAIADDQCGNGCQYRLA